MSNRTSRRAPRVSYAPPDEEEEGAVGARAAESDSEEEYDPVKQKRQRVIKVRLARESRSNRGPARQALMHGILGLHFDILCIIAAELRPCDLLALARAGEELYAFLKLPSHQVLWRYARRAVGLPDLRANDGKFSEYLYARFVYDDPKCFNCSNSCSYIDCFHKLRYCQSCREELWIKTRAVTTKFPDLHPRTISCAILSHKYDKHSNEIAKVYRVSEVQEISAKLFELEEEDDTAFEEKILSRLKLAGTRTRRSSAVTLPEVVAGSTPLEEYINARQVLVQDIDIDGTFLESAIEKALRMPEKERSDERSLKLEHQKAQRKFAEQKCAQEIARIQTLPAVMRWIQDLSDIWDRSSIWVVSTLFTNDNWPKYHPRVAKLLAKIETEANDMARQLAIKEKERCVRQCRIHRVFLIIERCKQLVGSSECLALSDAFKSRSALLSALGNFPHIKFLVDDDLQSFDIDRAHWNERKEGIKAEILALNARTKQDVVRQIIQALDGEDFVGPDLPPRYSPLSIDEFFALPTFGGKPKFHTLLSPSSIVSLTTRARAMRSMYELAGIDELQATEAELDAIEGEFAWDRPSHPDVRGDWREILKSIANKQKRIGSTTRMSDPIISFHLSA